MKMNEKKEKDIEFLERMEKNIEFLEMVHQIFPYNCAKDVKIRQELIKIHFEKWENNEL